MHGLEKEFGVRVEGDEEEVKWPKASELLLGSEFLQVCACVHACACV